MQASSIKVWDRPVRILHWALAVAVALAWLSGESLIGVKLHEPAGYVALGIVLIRMTWGVAGGSYARFSQWVRGPRAVWRYVRLIARGNEPRYLGHNPLGGWMVLALFGCVIALGATGRLYTTDAFWGTPWLDTLHQLLAWVLLALICLHLAGVIFTSLRHRENLVGAMFSGKKNAPTGDDIA